MRSCLELSFILTCRGFEPITSDPIGLKSTEEKKEKQKTDSISFFTLMNVYHAFYALTSKVLISNKTH